MNRKWARRKKRCSWIKGRMQKSIAIRAFGNRIWSFSLSHWQLFIWLFGLFSFGWKSWRQTNGRELRWLMPRFCWLIEFSVFFFFILPPCARGLALQLRQSKNLVGQVSCIFISRPTGVADESHLHEFRLRSGGSRVALDDSHFGCVSLSTHKPKEEERENERRNDDFLCISLRPHLPLTKPRNAGGLALPTDV